MYLDKAVNKLLARLQARKKTACIVSPTVQAKSVAIVQVGLQRTVSQRTKDIN